MLNLLTILYFIFLPNFNIYAMCDKNNLIFSDKKMDLTNFAISKKKKKIKNTLEADVLKTLLFLITTLNVDLCTALLFFSYVIEYIFNKIYFNIVEYKYVCAQLTRVMRYRNDHLCLHPYTVSSVYMNTRIHRTILL